MIDKDKLEILVLDVVTWRKTKSYVTLKHILRATYSAFDTLFLFLLCTLGVSECFLAMLLEEIRVRLFGGANLANWLQQYED